MFNLFKRNHKSNEKFYEHSIETAVKINTLSLLEKLYQTSVLALTPEEMAQEITDNVRQGLHLELSGIFFFKKETDTLIPLAFSKSDEFIKNTTSLESSFAGIKITGIANHNFLKKVVYSQTDTMTDNLEDLYQGLVSSESLEQIKTKSGIETILLYPLIKNQEVLGVLFLAFNRDYANLNRFEQSSIKSIINVIALLLSKAYSDKNLQVSYEIEKKGREQMKHAYEMEKKAKEEIQELDKNKSEFMLITQHHLRTPLSVNIGFLDLLLTGSFGKVPKKINDALLKLQESTQKEIKVVDELLDVSSYQMGKEVIQLLPGTDMEELLEEALKDLKIQAEEKGIYLKFKKEGNIPKILADQTKLKLALINIIDNCVKYTKRGGVTVILKSENNKLLILIKDTGIGILKESLPDLFDQTFHRGEEAQKIFASGKGIGLFLSGKIIRGHHGKIWVESEGKGKGAIFHIELPII